MSNYSSLLASVTPSITSTNGNATVICGGTVGALSVTLSASPGTGNSYAFTVMVSGTASGNTCTISDAATTCTSGASVVVNPGDTVNVRATPNSNPTARSATWSSSYTRVAGSPTL